MSPAPAWRTPSAGLVPGSCVSTQPASAPTSPNAPALKSVRIGGLRRMIATIVGAVTYTNVAGAHPNSTSAATAKTKPRETPFASAPSTGTGNRSVSIDASRNATTPSTTVVDPGSRRKTIVATRYAPTPTNDTGATTASSFVGGSALTLIPTGRRLPGEVEAAACEGREGE